MSLRDYLGVLARWWWVIALIAIVAGLSAYELANRKTPQYKASVTLLYEMEMDVSNPLYTGSSIDPNVTRLDVSNTIALLDNPEVVDQAKRSLVAAPKAPYSVSAVATTDTNGTNLVNGLTVSAVSTNPHLATDAANTYASAMIDFRTQSEKARIALAVKVIEGTLAGFAKNAHNSADYILLEQRLRDLQILAATGTGNFQVAAPAHVPTAPFTPHPKRDGILAIAVGLFAGICIAFLLEQLDTRIRTEDRLVGIMRQPILGRIPRLSNKALEHGVLFTVSDPAGSAAEAIRISRGNLEFTQVDGDHSSVLVTSSVQGEGKSVTVCNLAVALALAGRRIVVVDGDLRRPRVHSYFGLPNNIGVSTVASGGSKLTDALKLVSLRPGDGNGLAVAAASLADDGSQNVPKLHVLSSGPLPPNPGEMVASKRFAAIIEQLEEQFDLVIVDSPAMLVVGDAAALASNVDGMVYLVDMKLARRPMLQEAARRLGQVPCRKLGLVIIRDHERSAYYRGHYYNAYAEDGGMLVSWRSAEKREDDDHEASADKVIDELFKGVEAGKRKGKAPVDE